MMEYQTSVCVRKIPVARFLQAYYDPVALYASCRGCPDYGMRWSCPPGTPDTRAFFAPYTHIYVIGAAVHYTEACRSLSRQPGMLEPIRQRTYGVVKRALHEVQLALEARLPGAVSIAAGRCEQCAVCTRPSGAPCARPERMRYSFSAFRCDLTRIARDELQMPLQWSMDGLPAYNVAIAALLVRDK